MQGFLEVFAFWGESGTFGGEHSVEDHYHKRDNILGGRLPPSRPPGSLK